MKNYYKIDIPSPCHEDWNAMTPNKYGKHCSSCNKTVIDFTKMDSDEIESFLKKNATNKICGRIKNTNLSTIKIQVPSSVFESQISFHKLFLLSLLITMGSFLFSCTDQHNQAKKISAVEVVSDSITNSKSNKNSTDLPIIMGAIPVPTNYITGDLIIESNTPPPYNSYTVEVPPRYKNTPSNLSKQESLKFMSTQISLFIKSEFEKLKATLPKVEKHQRIAIKFTINKDGSITDVIARGRNDSLVDFAKNIVYSLPKFVPGKHDGKNVPVEYTLPILYGSNTK